MVKLAIFLFMQIYSLVILGLWILVIPFSFYHKIGAQVRGRMLTRSLRVPGKVALFFCSSAGEYEQAKPLMEQIKEKGFVPVIAFFSFSGYSFAKARSESSYYFLSPLDTYFHWSYMLAVLRPQITFIVRHELWPAFIWCAYQYGPIYLVNCEVRTKLALVKKVYRRLIYQAFTKIFVTSEQDQKNLHLLIGQNDAKIIVAGDTKYDRVVERAQKSQAQLIKPVWMERKKIIVGSCWQADLEVILPGFKLLKANPEYRDWFLLVVPHDLSQSNQVNLKHLCESFAFNTVAIKNYHCEAISTNEDIVILTQLGILAELYRHSELAFVGGACHHKVHNILEPAFFGCPVAFGTRYHNSPEARVFVQQNLVTVIESASNFSDWCLLKGKTPYRDKLLEEQVNKLIGASARIMEQLDFGDAEVS